MSQLFQRDFRSPGKTQTISRLQRGSVPVPPANPEKQHMQIPCPCFCSRIVQREVNLKMLLAFITHGPQKPKTIASKMFLMHVGVYMWITLGNRGTWCLQRHLLEKHASRNPLPAHAPPAGTSSMEPKVSTQVPASPHHIPKANGDKPCFKSNFSLAQPLSPSPWRAGSMGSSPHQSHKPSRRRFWSWLRGAAVGSVCSSSILKKIQRKLCGRMWSHRDIR